MPIIGEIKRGKELGFTGHTYFYKWVACIDCGKERWVGLSKNIPISTRCFKCGNQIKVKHNPHLFKKGEHNGIEFKKGEHRSPNTEFKKGHPSGAIPKGVRVSPQSEFKKGQHPSPRTEFRKGVTYGENHPRWKGGITPFNLKERHKEEYVEWRNKVFERDNYTCQDCKMRGGYLHAHHLKKWSDFPELRFIVDNGLTLCSKCHHIRHRKKKCQNP